MPQRARERTAPGLFARTRAHPKPSRALAPIAEANQSARASTALASRSSNTALVSRPPSHKFQVNVPPNPRAQREFGAGTELARAPWESTAVRRFAESMGRSAQTEPCVVEGPEGTILAAVGDGRDHRIAGDVLSRLQAERRVGRGMEPRDCVASSALVAKGRQPGPDGMSSFGVVYEHRDSTGKPHFVGETDLVCEHKWRLDTLEHDSVRGLLQQRGSTSVVWCGAGSGPVDAEANSAMRRAIVADRAERQRAAKLTGIKPYSRHGWAEV